MIYSIFCKEYASKLASLEKRERELKDKEEKFQRGNHRCTKLNSLLEMARVASLHKAQESQIKLDVGGTHYTTSISTLTSVSNSMLEAMFSGNNL